MQGIAHSVHTRLVARSKELHIEVQFLLERYALHRLLYRLSKSQHADRFLLKGAQLLLIWIGESARTTRDADLLGFGDLSDDSLRMIFTDLCTVTVEPDGVEYLATTLRIAPIREENAYGGRRILIQARLGNARLLLQIDVGIGDAAAFIGAGDAGERGSRGCHRSPRSASRHTQPQQLNLTHIRDPVTSAPGRSGTRYLFHQQPKARCCIECQASS